MRVTKKQLLIMYGTMLLLILFSTIFGYSNKNFKPKYGTTTANVNLRNTANLNKSSIMKVIKKNTNVKMVGEISDFYIVQLTNNEVGLLAKNYIKTQGTSLSGAQVYENFAKYYATVNGSNTNIRSGPGTNFKVNGKLAKGAKVEVIGRINNFSMIVTDKNVVGMIRSDLITKTTGTSSNNNNNGTATTPTTPNTNTSTEQSTVLTLINNARKENGLPALAIDKALNNVAKIKATDMVKNNYFSHNSPTYGTPFEMMKNHGITYKTAGENIAGNPSLENAVKSWLASEGHRKNILSPNYNYIGIGIEKNSTYGYVLVAMFIGK